MIDRASDRSDGTFTYSRMLSLRRDGKGSMNLYPNPATDQLTISLDDALLNSEAKLYNTAGRLLRTMTLPSSETPVNVKSLTPGFYIIRFTDGTARSFVKE